MKLFASGVGMHSAVISIGLPTSFTRPLAFSRSNFGLPLSFFKNGESTAKTL